MSIARRLVVNPANTDQRYVLWSNGYIEARGSAVPITDYENNASIFTANTKPVTFDGWPNPEPAIGLYITNWTTPAGWVLTIYGHLWAFGGAPHVPGAPGGSNWWETGTAEFLLGRNFGFASPNFGYVIDFVMNPANDGTGYLLLYSGDVLGFGTGIASIAHGVQFPDTTARQIKMDWSSKRYWLLDDLGRIKPMNGASSVTYGTTLTFPQYAPAFTNGPAQGGFALYDLSAVAKGFAISSYGAAYNIGSAPAPVGGPYNANARVISDLGIISDGTSTPLRLVALSENGAIREWVSSTAPTTAVTAPVLLSTLTLTTRPLIAWSYSDAENNAQSLYEVRVIASSVYSVGGTNEVQRLTPSGTISGGTFTITFNKATTTAIAFNASAATIQAALEALPNIGTGGVLCAGGPINSAFVSITFQNQMAAWDWSQVTVTSSLTGTAPVLTPSTTTAGVGINPASATAVFSTSGTTATTRSVTPTAELANTTYRAFVRTTDNSGLVSGWAFTQWTQNVAAMNVPTITPTVLGGLTGVSLALSVSTSGLDALAVFGVQYHDSDWDGVTWEWVRNGAAVAIVSGAATLVDYEARFGVVRSYRLIEYVYDSTTGDFRSSAPSTTQTATLTPRNVWALSNPFNSPTQSAVVRVQPGFKLSRSIRSAKFWPSGAFFPTVVTDGQPRAASADLGLWMLSNSERVAVEAMVNADVPLLLRDPFGRAWYVKLTDTFDEEIVRASPTSAEVTGIRDFHSATFAVQQVKRPSGAPVAGPLADVS